MNRIVLLNPGPVNVTPTVRDSLLRGDMCHREPEIAELIQNIRKKLVRVFNIEDQYKAALISGSGTAALEMAVSSCLSKDRTICVIQNGVYGKRIGTMSHAYGHSVLTLTSDWGIPPDLVELEKILEKHPEIEVVGMVHHETTTGLMNPLNEVATICRKYGKRLLVDAISSIAGEPFDFAETGADIVVGTANKCIQGFPGVSFVLVRDRELERLEKVPARSVYFDLYKNLIAQEKGETLFTPAIQAHYALDQALDELMDETVAGRIQRYAEAAGRLRLGFRDMGLEFLLDDSLHSKCLTALKLPEGVTYGPLHDHLRQNGYVIYAGQGGLSKTIFRIANMGDIRPEEFDRLLDVLREAVLPEGRG